MVIGVEPGQLYGLDLVDVSAFEREVGKYVGTDDRAPSWEAHYVEVEDSRVLVVTVDAPVDGDPIRTLRREFDSDTPGTIFIRHPGRTTRAQHDDIVMLEARALARQDRARLRLEVQVGVEDFALVDDSIEGLGAWIRQERQRRDANQPSPYDEFEFRVGPRVTAREYEQETIAWLNECAQALPAMTRAKAVARLPQPTIRVVLLNPTDRYESAVQVELVIGRAFHGFMDEFDAAADCDEWPSASRGWGTVYQRHVPADLVAKWPEVTRSHDATQIVWPPVDLRTRTPTVLHPVYLAGTHEDLGKTFVIRWRATSMSSLGEATGTLEGEVGGAVVAPIEMVPAGGWSFD
jgi:uncharacterized protein YndB with AHSA1/START domain